ncbi:MAG TPA: urease accessory protein UreE [Methylomirabilota bacterium]
MIADSIVIAGRAAPREPADLAGLEADVIELTAQERRRPRRRVVTRGERVLTLVLPSGETLAPGDLLYVGPGWYVTVAAASEALLAVEPRSPREAVRVALEVGRLHSALAIAGSRLLVPDEPATERLLRRLGVAWERRHEPFHPISTGSPH